MVTEWFKLRWRLQRPNQKAREAWAASLGVLRDEYLALEPPARDRNASAKAEIEAIFERVLVAPPVAAELVTRNDLWTVSRLLLVLLPSDQIALRVAQIRKSIIDLAGDKVIPDALQKKTDTIQDALEDERRQIAGELQRLRASTTIDYMQAEAFRASVLAWSFTAAAFCMAINSLVFVAFGYYCLWNLAYAPLAAAFGALGACISVALRIRDTEPFVLARNSESNTISRLSIWVSPIIGAIGAVLLVGAIGSGLITSQLATGLSFPSTCPSTDCPNGWSSFHGMLKQLTSADATRFTVFACLLSVAAGWSERLVPDLLEWVGKTSEPPGKK